MVMPSTMARDGVCYQRVHLLEGVTALRNRLMAVWDSVTSSFWFVPVLIIGSSMILAVLTLLTDVRLGSEMETLGGNLWLFARSPEAARSLLETIAGSMITVAGVSYSIVIVALTLASQQFGPRLLRNFMRDRTNQAVLGVFIGTFVYCLLVLRSIRGLDENAFVPHVSVICGMVLALGALFFLIYFMHHVSSGIRAENVVAEVAKELDSCMERIYPSRIGHGPDTSSPMQQDSTGNEIARIREAGRSVKADRTGYVQSVDGDAVMEMADENDLLIYIACRPGHFLPAGSDAVWAAPAESVDESLTSRLQSAIVVGRSRTPTQDIEFAVDQLVEVAVRALSPGINDPFTAINCIDYLGAALSELAGREMPSELRYRDGRLRVIAESLTFEGVVDSAYNQIRQNAEGNVSVLARTLESMASVAHRACRPEQVRAVRKHAEMVLRCAEASVREQQDLQDIHERYERLLQALHERETTMG